MPKRRQDTLRHVRLIGMVLALAALVPLHAHAQERDVAAAEALFTEGRRLMSEGDYERACPKLAESQRLDPGAGTALNLAECYEKLGRTATAWATWKEAATLARRRNQSAREDLARQRAAHLEAQLVRLSIVVPESSRVPGLAIERNGEPVREALWDTPIPVDPGSYLIEASAPGYVDWQQRLEVVPGGSPPTVTVPTLIPQASAASPQTSASTASPSHSSPMAPTQSTDVSPTADRMDDGSGTRTLGFVLMGVGAAGIGVGSYFGLDAISENDKTEQEGRCIDNQCDKVGFEHNEAARQSGNIATGAFAIGAIAAGAGLYFVLTAEPDSPETTSPQVGAIFTHRGGAIRLQGRF